MIKAEVQKQLISSDGQLKLNLNIEIEANEFIVIFGKSGVGKTSFLRMLAGLTEPDSGLISVNNKIWYDSKQKINFVTQKRKIGYVFQDYALFPNMNVRANLEFALDKKQGKEYIDELLEMFNITELSNRKPETLSGGQKQRVALARALAGKPDILLLDEPLSALDMEMRLKLQHELLSIHQKLKVTTIMVTHDLSEVFRLADRVFVIEYGKVTKYGKPIEVFTDNNISGKFKFTGEIIEIKKSDVIYILTILTGNNLVKVVATKEEIRELKPGDNVLVASKAFNPLIIKLSH